METLDSLLENLLLQNPDISDVHLEQNSPIWVRKGGLMQTVNGFGVSAETLMDFITRHSGQANPLDELKTKGDFDFGFSLSAISFRANAFFLKRRKVALALRRLRDGVPTPSELGLPDQLVELSNRAKGLLLVTGATGMGKTSTLASLIGHINDSRKAHIITIEDPVEYVIRDNLSKIDQREIGAHKDVSSFPTALRAALRQDPDIIVIGEMRDRETIQTALDAAETGHLVLATLHTMSAKQSVERITSAFSGDEKDWICQTLGSVLLGIFSQTLIESTKTTRVLAWEMLVNTSNIRQAIKENKLGQISGMMETGSKYGQCLLNKNLADMVAQKLITREDALYYTYDQKGLENEIIA